MYQTSPKAPSFAFGRAVGMFTLSPDTVPDSQEHKNKLAFEEWMNSQGIRFEGGETGVPARIMPLRHAAVCAGLGIFRRNNFFYGEKGSYYALEGYLIDRECEYRNHVTLRPCAEGCTLCRRSCRTKSLSAPFTMNPFLCVSFLTTFGEGRVPEGLSEEDLGKWIFGCDACPYNRHNWNEGEDFCGLEDLEELMRPENIIAAGDDELRERVIPRRSCAFYQE